jgi:hypothetical protein
MVLESASNSEFIEVEAISLIVIALFGLNSGVGVENVAAHRAIHRGTEGVRCGEISSSVTASVEMDIGGGKKRPPSSLVVFICGCREAWCKLLQHFLAPATPRCGFGLEDSELRRPLRAQSPVSLGPDASHLLAGCELTALKQLAYAFELLRWRGDPIARTNQNDQRDNYPD